jgi:hypothetical protein
MGRFFISSLLPGIANLMTYAEPQGFFTVEGAAVQQ